MRGRVGKDKHNMKAYELIEHHGWTRGGLVRLRDAEGIRTYMGAEEAKEIAREEPQWFEDNCLGLCLYGALVWVYGDQTQELYEVAKRLHHEPEFESFCGIEHMTDRGYTACLENWNDADGTDVFMVRAVLRRVEGEGVLV